MVVKSKRGRRRYIAFMVSPSMDKGTLINGLNSACSENESVYVVQCQNERAIIRCPPEMVERSIELMGEVDPCSVSMLTSGTLKTLRGKYPELGAPERHR